VSVDAFGKKMNRKVAEVAEETRSRDDGFEKVGPGGSPDPLSRRMAVC